MTTSCRIEFVQPESVLSVWLKFEKQFTSAIHRANDTTPELALAEILSGSAFMYAIHDSEDIKAAFVLKLWQYPTHNNLLVWLLGGSERDIWTDEFEQFMSNAQKHFQCKHIEARVRPALRRILANHGFSEQFTTMVKL